MVSVRAKRAKMAAEAAAAAAEAEQQKAVAMAKVRELQDELQKVTDKLVKKTEELERKYDRKKVPIYDRRSLVINSIPEFWLTAFLKHPTLGTLLTQEDQQIFRYLDSLYVEDLQYPQKGYCITFNFKINPYFENETLSKTVDYTDEGLETTCTTIRWKEGKAPPAISAVPVEERDKRLLPFITSFFKWFGYAAEDTMGSDQDLVGDMIKGELWVNPLNHEGEDGEWDDEDDD
ncbi:hypothetical protein ABFS82_08G022400 [Erythranthe guttata]|uniref:NAP1-related protein 2-like isoform X1 n=1 Tax=Erythranthe guttata TaxID=4155 RepID=UPI00064DEFAD|nr:PREDICTED: NAP1-related protein 2-like isoform X1 [Erythranthe guttata]|eukprot:XP_012841362.1 PREDICTED: NAP1-related protein 2-like isoform X1 [Erythranthe guttata]